MTFDFRSLFALSVVSLHTVPFSPIASPIEREAEERLNSEQQELSALQSELIDAEVQPCKKS